MDPKIRRNRRSAMTRAGWAVAVAMFSALPTLSFGQCQLQLAASNSSILNFNGTSTQPLRQPITLQGSPTLSLTGDISLQLAGACPNSASSLTSDLKSSIIQPQSGQQLALLPANLTAQVGGGLATLAISGISFNLSSSALDLAGGGSQVYAGLTGGAVVVQSALGGGPPVSLAGTVANSTANVTATTQGDLLQLTLAGLNFSFASSFDVASIKGQAVYFLTGTIVAKASIASLLGGGGSSSRRAPAPAPAAQTAALLAAVGSSPVSAPAPAPVLAAPTPLPATTSTAIRQLSCLNSGNSCGSCNSGWTGTFCDVCQSDSACNAFLGTSDAVCNTSSIYANTTAFKSYKCDIQGSVLGTVLNKFALACNTTSGVNQTGGYCQVGLAVQGAEDNAAVCAVTGCAFNAGSSKVQCRNAQCSCQKGTCPDQVASYANLIQGKDVSIDCDSGGVCNVDITDFPIKVSLPCTFGDCQSPTNPALFSSNATFIKATSSNSLAAVIAAIPLMVLAAIALLALLSAAFSSHLCFARSKSSSHEPLLQIRDLRFSDITVSVKLSRLASSQHYGLQSNSLDPSHSVGSGSTPVNGAADSNRDEKESIVDKEDGGNGGTVDRNHRQGRLGLAARLKALSRRRQRLLILSDVSGHAASGELVGILGPSGSGKSTLLSVLAGSSAGLGASARVSGAVLLDGRPMEQVCSKQPPAFVPQSEFLLPSLTVRESLWYSCRLRLPDSSSAAAVKARVSEVVEELGLGEVADSLVGGAGGIRGISGGERRRVSIGMEMVTQASLLLLDEPTSGLDSVTATSLLLSLRQIARAGRIVLLSIHQPSPLMFSLLDNSYLMCRGRVAFAGPPASAEPFFAAAGLPCPAGQAIAEHMLSVVVSSQQREKLLAHAAVCPPQTLREAAPQKEPLPDVGSKRVGASLRTELAVLSWRAMTDIRRNPVLLLLHMGIGIVMGVLVGAIFRNLTPDIAGAQGRLGAIFFTLCLAALTSLTTVDLLTAERGLVVRELQAGYYRPITYYLSKATLDAILLRVLPIVTYSIPVYTMAELHGGADRVALFFCGVAVFAATIGLLSMALTIGFNSAGKASLLMNVILLIQLLFAGYFKDVQSITPVLRWIRWISAFYYAFESLVINEISGIVFSFTAAPGVSATLTGDTFLSAVRLQPGHLTRDVALLDALFAAFALLGIALLYLTMPRPLRLRPRH